MWGQYDSYLTGCRDVLGLDIPQHKKYKAWEDCAKDGGYRIMHKEFCIVSNFPKWIKKDAQNRPHCITGSQMEWRDGFATYYISGIRFEKEMFEKLINHKMSFQEILAIVDVDQRNQAMRFVGNEEREKFLENVGAKLIDSYEKMSINGKKIHYRLYLIPKNNIFQNDVKAMWYECPSTGMNNFSGVPSEMRTVADSMAWKGSNEEIALTSEDWFNCIPLQDES